MRTTLRIADDVFFAAREIAAYEHRAVGDVISDLARRALTQSVESQAEGRLAAYGIHPLPRRGGIVTNALIDRLLHAE